ncbi:hypothetical protein [Saccharopolyspora soli]|nr:hypothetical protein [Saccharopolyspora soli]
MAVRFLISVTIPHSSTAKPAPLGQRHRLTTLRTLLMTRRFRC